MSDSTPTPPTSPHHFQHKPWHIRANLMAGVLTAIPAVIVWVVFSFIFEALGAAGKPIADYIIHRLPPDSTAAHVLAHPVVAWAAYVIVAIVLLYLLGALASQFVGQQLIAGFEKLIERIPFVQSIYSASKQLVGALKKKPDGPAAVVLVDFPGNGTKAIGLVMRTYKDEHTGEDMAAVFAPTSPNPTSGYLLMAPMASLVPTHMTVDQAMTMIVSGGAVAPPELSRPEP